MATENIATMYWQTANRDRNAYGFIYDELNRMNDARYANITKTPFITTTAFTTPGIFLMTILEIFWA